MLPSSRDQIRWGLAFGAIALALIVILAFFPDPLHRQRVMVVGLDHVEGIGDGAPIYFRGAEIGAVRHVALVPALRTFDVSIGVRRDFRPSACSFMTVSASNPLTQPHLELVALETSARQCPAARVAAACVPVQPVRVARDRLTGCRRSPDLIALATGVITQASGAATAATAMAVRLQAMLAGGGGGGSGGVTGDLQGAARSLSAVLGGIDHSMAPGRGDLALTLANVRRASGQAARVDVGAVNGTLASVSSMVAENRSNVAQMVANGQAISAQTRDLLQTSARSLAETSDNLARVSASMDSLTERIAGDPGFAVRGQRFADPPPVARP